MSETQLLLAALGAALHDNRISEDMCEGLILALDGVPEEYHFRAFEALIGKEIKD